MESMANFFESINKMLGVSGPGELVFHPVFMGICIVLALYALFTGMKYFALILAGVMGGAAIFHYLYPKDSSQLNDIVQFLGAMGVLALVLVYIGFIRD